MLVPLNKYVVVLPSAPRETQSSGGVWLLNRNNTIRTGTVVKQGSGVCGYFTNLEGKTVVFPAHAGHDYNDHVLLKIDDILAVEDNNDYEIATCPKPCGQAATCQMPDLQHAVCH